MTKVTKIKLANAIQRPTKPIAMQSTKQIIELAIDPDTNCLTF
jgi:hypothetical protein